MAAALNFAQPPPVTYLLHHVMDCLHSPDVLWLEDVLNHGDSLIFLSSLLNFQLSGLIGTSGILIKARQIIDYLALLCMHDPLNLLDSLGLKVIDKSLGLRQCPSKLKRNF